MADLEFFYDVVCPWAFLASRRVEALAARTSARLRWRPVLLGGLYRHHNGPDDPNLTFSPARRAMGERDLQRHARRAGLSLEINRPRTVDAMRLLSSCASTARGPLTHALFEAVHLHGSDVADPQVLGAIARAHDVDPSCIAAGRQPLFDTTAEAAEAGVFGVPTYRVDARWWWGGDREHLVERALGGAPPPAPAPAPATAGRTVEVFHDFSSPFSYLGCTQIERVAAACGATVQWRPMLLGALFQQIDTPMVPIASFHAAKSRYLMQDLRDWAAYWEVPFTFTPHFPLRTVTALRLALQEPTLTGPLYAAAWARQRDVADPDVLRVLCAEQGLDADHLLAGTQDPQVKAALRANTDAAIAAGACGAPTFLVGEEAVWGQDRLDFVHELLTAS